MTLLNHLFKRSNVKTASVRYRVCQIIADTMHLIDDLEIEYVYTICIDLN